MNRSIAETLKKFENRIARQGEYIKQKIKEDISKTNNLIGPLVRQAAEGEVRQLIEAFATIVLYIIESIDVWSKNYAKKLRDETKDKLSTQHESDDSLAKVLTKIIDRIDLNTKPTMAQHLGALSASPQSLANNKKEQNKSSAWSNGQSKSGCTRYQMVQQHITYIGSPLANQ